MQSALQSGVGRPVGAVSAQTYEHKPHGRNGSRTGDGEREREREREREKEKKERKRKKEMVQARPSQHSFLKLDCLLRLIV